jgi:hypothetical protein
MLLAPRAHAFSEAWTPPPEVARALGGPAAFARLAGFARADLLAGYAIWLRVWAFLVLSPPERAAWVGLGPVSRRIEWLWARTAAKDAVRELCRAAGGPSLGAADIVLEDGDGGMPSVAGGWCGRLPIQPRIAVVARDDITLAIAWPGPADLPAGLANHALALCQPSTGEHA